MPEILILDSEGCQLHGPMAWPDAPSMVELPVTRPVSAVPCAATPLSLGYTIARCFRERRRGDGVWIYRRRNDFHA